MVNATEMARHHRLQKRGIGGSHEAVMVRRKRERGFRVPQIEEEKTPGWVKLGLEESESPAIDKTKPEVSQRP